jgi:alcohol dehydrogenase
MPGLDGSAENVEQGRGATMPGGARVGSPIAAQRHRPRGWLRYGAGFLSPDAAAGTRLILERDRILRLRRLVGAVGDRAGQRRNRTRPRMRALQLAPGGRLGFKDVPVPPPPAPDGAIVHPIASATCDLDCPLALGATQFALPLHLGHECVAEVLTVGEQVTTVKPGDRVVVPFQVSCGLCPACRAGRTANCTSVPPVSMYGFGLLGGHWGGAFSDQLAVPYAEAMLVALPDGIDPVAAASVADNICDAYRHIAPHLPALLEADPDAEVLILAALSPRSLFSASCPLYTGLIARAYGARNVHLVDRRPHVRAHAERLGVHALKPRELHAHRPSPLVIHISGDPLSTALSRTAADGVCTSSGGLHRGAWIPFLQMYGRNVTLHVGRTHARTLIPRVLDLLIDGQLRPEAVVTNVAPIDDAPNALREHFLGGGVKTVLTA